jgi:hypothetical protein
VTNEDGGSEPPAEEPKDTCEITDDDNELNEDDEFDWSLNEPVIKSSSEALKVVERLSEFHNFEVWKNFPTSFLCK